MCAGHVTCGPEDNDDDVASYKKENMKRIIIVTLGPKSELGLSQVIGLKSISANGLEKLSF